VYLAVVRITTTLDDRAVNIGVCILAGGLSERMGREKARMWLGRRTLLGHVRRAAEGSELNVRVIRKDIVPRCGPLGGIYTGLKTSKHEAELFLSCDMPFVSTPLLKRVAAYRCPVFVECAERAGFPLMLLKGNSQAILKEIRAGRRSLQNLARRLGAKILTLPLEQARQLLNVNTQADWEEAMRRRSELPL